MVLSVSLVALAMLAAAWTFGQRPLQTPVAFGQLQVQVAAARSLAAIARDGATIIVEPRAAENGATHGFRSVLYAGRPDAVPLTAQPLAPLISQADIVESTTGAAPPFAIFVSPGGDFRVLGGYPPPASFDTSAVPAVSQEPPCPAPLGTPYVLVLSTDSASQTLELPCSATAPGSPLPWTSPSPSAPF